MGFKKLVLVLLAIFALSAVAASSASAAEEFEESGSAWYTGASPGTRLPEGEKSGKTVTGEAGSEKISLESTIAGQPLDITWTIWDLTSSFIWNSRPSFWSATWFQIWSLRGVVLTLPSPTVCSVKSELTLNNLKATVGMKKGSSTIATVKFVAKEGTSLGIVEILGASCPVSGSYKLTGTLYGEASNVTGVFSKKQPIKFSKAIQESAGSASSLKFGANNAFITGTLNVNSETEFAVKKE